MTALLANPRAAITVSCPKCHATPGTSCSSTGGGNDAYVPTHKQRIDRIEGWPEAMQDEAAELVLAVRRKTASQGAFAAYEQAAAPIEVKAKKVTPKGVQLSEKQASYVEYAAEEGVLYAPTGHFHGDHEKRQTINALETKGIVVQDGEDAGTGERFMRLSPFGWQVYRQHRLIIRRLDDAEVDRLEEAAR